MHPYLFHIGHLLLPTYGLLAAAGLIAALSLSLQTSVRVHLSPDALWNAGLFAIVSAFLLSRLLLVLFHLHSFLAYPILLLTVPSLTPTGVLLTAAASLVYLRVKRLPILSVLDAWAPCGTLLWAFLALGHFAEGSDPGLPTTSRVALPIPPAAARLHPVTLYVTLCALALTVLLLRTLPPHSAAAPQSPGTTAALGFVLAGVAQFLLTFLRQPVPVDLLLDPIQWVALAMVVTGTLLYLAQQRLRPHAI